jgi:hypothetical protein
MPSKASGFARSRSVSQLFRTLPARPFPIPVLVVHLAPKGKFKFSCCGFESWGSSHCGWIDEPSHGHQSLAAT